MQVLARLTVGAADGTPDEPGELLDSLVIALACDRDDLQHAVLTLAERRLVAREEEGDGDQRISITTAGLIAVQSWLDQTAPLLGGWPTGNPAADDATE
jgi:hypothetical protein